MEMEAWNPQAFLTSAVGKNLIDNLEVCLEFVTSLNSFLGVAGQNSSRSFGSTDKIEFCYPWWGVRDWILLLQQREWKEGRRERGRDGQSYTFGFACFAISGGVGVMWWWCLCLPKAALLLFSCPLSFRCLFPWQWNPAWEGWLSLRHV